MINYTNSVLDTVHYPQVYQIRRFGKWAPLPSSDGRYDRFIIIVIPMVAQIFEPLGVVSKF